MYSFHVLAKSFVELVRHLFTVPGVKTFLSQRICQDPLEKFFGCQRQRGGTHDNPNVSEFLHNTQALRVINSSCKDPARGNCRGGSKRGLDLEQENRPLPKRPRRGQNIPVASLLACICKQNLIVLRFYHNNILTISQQYKSDKSTYNTVLV